MPIVTIKDVKTLEGTTTTLTLEGPQERTIECEGRLTAIPALIDPHVHFRTPGQEYKEDFGTGAQAAIAGGVTTVFDMPNNEPPTVTLARMEEKIKRIDQQLKRVDIPLRYGLFFGADNKNIGEIQRVKNKIIGIKVFMAGSTGHLYVDDDKALERIFQLAAQENILVAVHAESQKIINENQANYKSPDVRNHSIIRSREAAIRATTKALDLAREYGTEVYFCHVSTKEELELLKDAKQDQMLVYIEVTPQHLFFTDKDYDTLGTKIQMNPPVRSQEDHNALWIAINEDWIDVIGTDHAPHTLQEKAKPYPESPSGVPGVETRLPLLLNAYNQGRISLNKIVELTRSNIDSIFNLEPQKDLVLVDLNLKKEVRDQDQKTKCGWSPYSGRVLQGWPLHTILKGRVYDL